MNKRNILFLLVLVFLIVVAYAVISTSKAPAYKKGSSSTYDLAISSAITLYKRRVTEGVGMSTGPCLTNDLMPGWVVDIVHSPRDSIDDLSQNQCQAYLEGRATHFVELDVSGNLVRVR